LRKFQEKFGRNQSYVTKVIAESVKGVKDHGFFLFFFIFNQSMN